MRIKRETNWESVVGHKKIKKNPKGPWSGESKRKAGVELEGGGGVLDIVSDTGMC